MGRSRSEAEVKDKRTAVRPVDRVTPVNNTESAKETANGLRSLQQAGLGDGPARSSASLTTANLRAVQRTAGNRATCQMIKVQRLQHPDFPKKASAMNDMELSKAWRFHAEGDLFGHGLPPKDFAEVRSEMRKRGLALDVSDPLKDHTDLMPTGGSVATEVAKPTFAVGATLGGNLGARGLSTASGAISPGGQKEVLGHTLGGPTSTHGAVGGEVLGGLLLADSLIGVGRGFQAMSKAAKSGDTAGHRLGAKKVQQQSWGVAGGATGVAASGVKLGAALGSTAAGLAAAAGGLGIAGGALTAAQGSWKIYLAGKKSYNLSKITLLSANGKKWKEYVFGREKRKAGINALKVAAGALGVAAGALLITSNPVGWAVGIAALVVGGSYALGKAGSKIYDVTKRRNATKKAEDQGQLDSMAKAQPPEKIDDDPKRRKEVHALADKVAQENSENARYAAAMIAALQKGTESKLDWLVTYRDKFFPDDTDFKKTRAGLPDKMQVTEEDLERHDAELILNVLNVPPYMALSESGQDLIQKKLSVAEAS